VLRYITVRVKMTETSKRNVECYGWEVPVLMAAHEGKCKVVEGRERLIDREPPDAGYEFDRLERKYKAPRNADGGLTETPFVGLIYGAGSLGVGRLADAIRQHTVTDLVDPLSLDPGTEVPVDGGASLGVGSVAEEATPISV
jgi:hypothetical protein